MKNLAKIVLVACALALAIPAASAQVKPATGNSAIATFLQNLAGIKEAVDLATAVPSIQDPVGAACWKNLAGLDDLIGKHPLPLTGKVAADIEAQRLFGIAINQICGDPNCSQVFADAQNMAAAITGTPVTISLTSICAKVPHIGTTVAKP